MHQCDAGRNFSCFFDAVRKKIASVVAQRSIVTGNGSSSTCTPIGWPSSSTESGSLVTSTLTVLLGNSLLRQATLRQAVVAGFD
jgi:hypothetical protein